MTSLPLPTIELGLAERDLEEFGYCLLRDALTRDQISELSTKLSEQANDEKREGRAFEDGGKKQQWGDFRDELGSGRRDRFRAASGGVNQRVWMLVNKGRCFIDLLYHTDVLQLVRSVIGNELLLSSHTANIAREGGLKMPLHTDQWWMPPPIEATANPLPVGSISRTTFEDGPQSVAPIIAPAACVNVIWMLCDVSENNGGTRLVPRSHSSGRQPVEADDKEESVVAAEAPAGSALIIDGRLWHGTGANKTSCDRLVVLTTFCGPQFRSQENFALGARDTVLREADSHLLGLLGFRVWNGYGRTADPTEEFVTRSG